MTDFFNYLDNDSGLKVASCVIVEGHWKSSNRINKGKSIQMIITTFLVICKWRRIHFFVAGFLIGDVILK